MEVQKLNWDKFKDKFHVSWHPYIKGIVESEEVYNIYQQLKKQKSKGFIIAPHYEDTFRSFEIDLDRLKVVIMAMSPYPQVENGTYKANVIAIDCRNYGGISPSLAKLYEGIEDDLYDGMCLSCERENVSLQYLIDQGVMLTNTSLTCTKDSPDVHNGLWKPFWKQVFEKIFFQRTGLIFILMGKNAEQIGEYTNPVGHHILKCEHPVKSSYERRKMKHNNVFSQSNKLLEEMNGEDFKIQYNYRELCPF